MKNKRLILAGLVIWGVTGCSGGSAGEAAEPDKMSAEEGCIVKINEPGQKICYGMAKSEVEAIAGTGEESGRPLLDYQYEGGLRVGYRDDSVALLSLQWEESAYETIRGTGAGTSKAEMKASYGDRYALEEGVRNLDYFFNMENKEPLVMDDLMKQRGEEEMQGTLIVSATFDSSDAVDHIIIMDRRMAIYFQ